jgi:hypothetical protein
MDVDDSTVTTDEELASACVSEYGPSARLCAEQVEDPGKTCFLAEPVLGGGAENCWICCDSLSLSVDADKDDSY